MFFILSDKFIPNMKDAWTFNDEYDNLLQKDFYKYAIIGVTESKYEVTTIIKLESKLGMTRVDTNT